jgi:perosamine synthetase
MSAIGSFCAAHNLKIVEDGAEALGASYDGKPVGCLGDVSCFSLYANKLITCGEGGMIGTNDERIASRARALRSLCFGAKPESRYTHEEVGFSFRLSGLQAAFANAQLEFVSEAVARINEAYEHYERMLGDETNLDRPSAAMEATICPWGYIVLLRGASRKQRLAVQQSMARAGVETRALFTPLHKQPFYKAKTMERFPCAENAERCGIHLPLFVDMKDREVAYVVSSLLAAIEKNCRN